MKKEIDYKDDSLLTEKEVAGYLKVSLPTLRLWRMDKKNLPYFSLSSRAVRYRFEDVKNFLTSKKIQIN